MFNSEEFKEAWIVWKKHKLEKHGSPYTPTSEEKALSALFKKSHGVESLAIISIEESIEHNWASIYIKTNNYNNGNINSKRISQTLLTGDISKESFGRL